MKNNAFKLYHKFLKIRNMGYIKTVSNDFQGVGLTFEKLIGKEFDNFYLPDFNNIEIKTFEVYTRQVIHLFNATPDGDYLFPIERIRNTLGYLDTAERKYKVFNAAATGNKFTYCGHYKKMILNINYPEKKIDFIAYRNNNNINIGISWSFDLLKERLNIKLTNLAIIKAKSTTIDGIKHFKYETFDFYKFKVFDTFLKLINDGVITVTFKISAYRRGKRIGQVHDRGTDFSIKYEDIEKLYDKIDVYDYWKISNNNELYR